MKTTIKLLLFIAIVECLFVRVKMGVMLYQMDNDEIGRLGTICMCEGYVGGTSIETISVPNSDTSKYLHNGNSSSSITIRPIMSWE